MIKTTGLDFLTRSTGFGSMEIWMRNLRQGVSPEMPYQPTQPCVEVGGPIPWIGNAVSIGGGYSWSDVYPIARASNLMVVGGDCPAVSPLGGYIQGGGHSAATSMYGLAADQLLEATVVLSNGTEVVVNACHNPDLFTALRGGGGGTYGIITSAKIKAYPETPIVSFVMTVSPLTANDIPTFLDSITFLYQSFALLAEAGLGGYASWTVYNPTTLFGGTGPTMYLYLGGPGQDMAVLQTLCNPLLAGLAPLNNTSLLVSGSYMQFNTYADYFNRVANFNTPPAGGTAVFSRLLSKAHLRDAGPLRYMLNMTAGQAAEQTTAMVAIVGGPGLQRGSDAFSGVNPAWRQAALLHVVARTWHGNASQADVEAIHTDITHVKGAAAVALAPDSGAYMNEADWRDPDYLRNFYGDALAGHQAAKEKYDPDGVFYCPTCVGSDQWVTDGAGRLCKP